MVRNRSRPRGLPNHVVLRNSSRVPARQGGGKPPELFAQDDGGNSSIGLPCVDYLLARRQREICVVGVYAGANILRLHTTTLTDLK